ncbi:YiiX/YebB-like N1pC/P60 family cysteine hydrolase [Aliarcobacter butzleri]
MKKLEDMEVGDILFVQSNKKYIYLAQIVKHFCKTKGKTSIKYREYHYTHVILSLGKGLFIDSVNKKGVTIFTIKELLYDFENVYKEKFQVFRNKALTDKQKEIIFKKAEFYLFESYNKGIFRKEKIKGRSYCSELIKNIYENAEIPISNAYISYPIDLYENFINDKNWNDDITQYYKDIIKKNDPFCIFSSNLYLSILSMNLLMNLYTKLVNVYIADFRILQQSSYSILYQNQNSQSYSYDEFTKNFDTQNELEKKKYFEKEIFSLLLYQANKINKRIENNYLKDLNDNHLITHWMDEINIERAKNLVAKDIDETERYFYQNIDILEKLPITIKNIIDIYKSGKIEQELYDKFRKFFTDIQCMFPMNIDVDEEIKKLESILDEQEYKKVLLAIKNIYKVRKSYINTINLITGT